MSGVRMDCGYRRCRTIDAPSQRYAFRHESPKPPSVLPRFGGLVVLQIAAHLAIIIVTERAKAE
jgi:hypothetical protein